MHNTMKYVVAFIGFFLAILLGGMIENFLAPTFGVYASGTWGVLTGSIVTFGVYLVIVKYWKGARIRED